MKEKDYYAKVVRHYTKKATQSMAIELKITKNDRLPWKALSPHQEEYMLQSERTFAFKIPDAGRGRKPYDIMLLKNAEPIMVIIFYKKNKTEIFEITLRNFIRMRESFKESKSLTKYMAATIGFKLDI